MRTLTSNTRTKVATRLGTEPIPFVEIQWGSGTAYYSYKDYVVSGRTYQGKILDFQPVAFQGKQDSLGQVSSVSLTIDDTDDSIRLKFNTEQIEHVVVKVWINYPDLVNVNDNILLMTGFLTSDIQWSEGERKLSFSVDSFLTDNEVGYAPVEGDFAGLLPDAVEKVWPLCFGSVVRVPAIKVIGALEGSLSNAVTNIDTSFFINGGEFFPQGIVITLDVGGVLMSGIMTGSEFVISQNVVSATSAVFPFAARVSGPFEDDPTVGWVSSYLNIEGKYVTVSHGGTTYMNKCVAQDDTRCTFQNSFPGFLPNTGDNIVEVSAVPMSTWYGGGVVPVITLNSSTIPDNITWTIDSGAKVKYWPTSNHFDVYVCNLIQSTVTQLVGTRNTNGQQVYSVLPASYYEVISDGTALVGRAATLIKMVTPLDERTNEGWSGEIFISQRSSKPVDTSPSSNTVKIIKYLLETYATGLTCDTTSFNQAIADVAPYPSNFALFDQQQVIGLCEDIAWQARCALYIVNGTVYIKYLSKEPNDATYIDEEFIFEKTLIHGIKSFDEVFTKINSSWKHNYSGEENAEHEFVYRNNIDLFGLVEKDVDFFIYNIEDLVEISTNFWGYRYSNMWRRVKLSTFIKNVHLEVFDCAELSLQTMGPNSIKGVLENVQIDANEPKVNIDVLVAANAGTIVENPLFWLAGVVGADLSTIIDPVADLVPFEGDIEENEDDSGGLNNLNDSNDTSSKKKHLVWLCIPTYIIKGQDFAFQIGLYDDPSPLDDAEPIKEAVWVRLDMLGTAGGSIIPSLLSNGQPSSYFQITNGVYSGTLRIAGYSNVELIHMFARAVHDVVPGNPTTDGGVDTNVDPSRSWDIPVYGPDEVDDAAEDHISITGLTSPIKRATAFTFTVHARKNTDVLIEMVNQSNPADVLGVQQQTGYVALPSGGGVFVTTNEEGVGIVTASIRGGSGEDTAVFRASYNGKACDPTQVIQVDSDVITIDDENEEDYVPTPPNGNPSSDDYDPAEDQNHNPNEVLQMVEIDYNASSNRMLRYRTRGLRQANGALTITDWGDWQEILTTQPCPTEE